MYRDFKGIWIPKEIWLNESLTLQEKFFLVEIDSLDNDNGCYATNEHFSNFFRLSKNRCSEVIKSLEQKGFIKITYVTGENDKKNIEKRILKLVEKSNRGIRFLEGGYSEKCEENNIDINKLNKEEETHIGLWITTEVIDKYKECISKQISDKELTILVELQATMGKELIIKAIDVAVKNNGKNLRYISTVLKDWKNKGFRTIDDVDQHFAEWATKNQKAKENREKQVERRARDSDINEKSPITNFANYPGQRNYDWDNLEKKLLGWDKYD
jgi:DnaD/phage-associated family protein